MGECAQHTACTACPVRAGRSHPPCFPLRAFLQGHGEACVSWSVETHHLNFLGHVCCRQCRTVSNHSLKLFSCDLRKPSLRRKESKLYRGPLCARPSLLCGFLPAHLRLPRKYLCRPALALLSCLGDYVFVFVFFIWICSVIAMINGSNPFFAMLLLVNAALNI